MLRAARLRGFSVGRSRAGSRIAVFATVAPGTRIMCRSGSNGDACRRAYADYTTTKPTIWLRRHWAASTSGAGYHQRLRERCWSWAYLTVVSSRKPTGFFSPVRHFRCVGKELREDSAWAGRRRQVPLYAAFSRRFAGYSNKFVTRSGSMDWRAAL